MECIVPAAQPEIAVFLGPTELPNYGLIEFGVTTNGTPVNRVLTITNRGDRQLVVDNVSWYGDFSSTNGTYFTIASGSATNFTVRFNAATNGSHSSYIAFYNDDGDGGDGIERPFILNLAAICNAGPAPTVTLTAPATNLVIQLPTNLVLAATASAQGASITNVEFVARKGSLYYVLGYDTTAPYGMTWNNPAAGTYVLMAGARDSNGRIGISAGVNLEVKAASTNVPPVAAQDYLAVLANSTYNVLPVLDNDADPEGEIPIITSVFDLHGGHAEVINNGQNILYIPPFGIRGGDYFRYTITDGQGGFASSVVNLRIEATDAPRVQIVTPPPNATLTAGTATNILAVVTPADFQGVVEFFFHDHKIGQASAPPYSISWAPIEDPCNCGLLAVATDVFGQIGTSDPVPVNITPPFGDAAPVARIANLANEIVSVPGHTYSRAATIREGLFELFGDAYDPNSSPVWYKVRIFNSERELVRDVTPPQVETNGFRLGPVNNGSLGVLDLSLIENGLYDLELTVRAGYRQSSTNVRFALESDLKIGHFSFSEQDLVLPVNGFPLTITRTYNSLNLKKADFGRSWTFTFSDVQLELDEDRQLTESLFEDEGDESVEPSGQFFSMRVGGERNVTLTLPDGRRTTFYYYLEPTSCDSSEFKFCAWPRWVAGPGVFATLRAVNDVKLAILPWSGGMKWWTDDGSSSPESYEFPGYILTMPDGTEYRIERESLGEKTFVSGGITGNYANVYGAGRLTEIKSRSNDKIKIGTNRIDHLNPSGQLTRSIWMQRDEENRIIAINDPVGGSNGVPVVKYDYAGDNLVRVHRLVDRLASNYLTTTYTYTNRTFPHYITGITDPRGVRTAKTYYDEGGRISAVDDADGRTTRFIHSLSNRAEIIVDRLGHTNSFVYDLRGNVLASTNALGEFVLNAYDQTNQLLSVRDALSNTNRYAYDTNGNRIHVVDALGHTNSFTYDAFGSLLSQIDPLGNVTSNRYDNTGNLTNVIRLNAQGQIVEQSSSKFADGHLVETRNGNNQVTAAFGYDTYGNLTNAVDANQVSRSFKYDANGNQTNVSYVWAGPGGSAAVSVTTEYDADGKVIRTVDPNNSENRTSHNPIGKADFTIDRFGNTNRFVYDSRGALIQVTYPNATFTRTVYDENGRAILATDRNQITGTRTEYDSVGRVTNTVRLTGVSINIVSDSANPGQVRSVMGASGTILSTSSIEYLANGWVKSRTGADGKKTTYDYWADGQMKSVTDALTNTTYFEYDAAGHQKLVRDALNRTNRFEYDAAGRLTKAIFANNSSISNVFNSLGQRIGQIDQAQLLTQFGYDLSGALTNVTKPLVPDPESGYQMTPPVWSYEYDPYGRLSVVRDPKGRTNTFGYDAVGRPLIRRLPMGQTETNEYNAKGQVWKKCDFKGQKTEFVYDKFGRVAAKFYFHAGAAYPSNAVCYQYNQLDQLWKIVERSGPDATTNACDGYASMVGLPFGGSGSSGGLMARVARVPSQTLGGLLALMLLMLAPMRIPRAARRQLVMSLVEAWRVQQEVEVAPVKRFRLPSLWWRAVTVVVVMALLVSDPHFDALFTARAACPMPANASTATTRITEFAYDAEGRLAQVNAPEGVINYGYDLATGRHNSTCTKNSEVAYGYDELGRLKSVSVLKRNGITVSPPENTIYGYTAVGSRETVTLPNGVVSTYKYDSLNRLTNLTHKAGTTNLASYSYQLHPTGRRTNAVEVLLNTDDNTYVTNTLSWSYDALYRLTNEVSTSSLSALAYTRQYEYDKAGNRMKQTRGTETITYQYNPNDQLTNEVSSVSGTTTYAYDANGSVTNKTTSGGTVSYAYNLANKLSSVTVGGVTTSYLYNDSGIRVRSTTGGSATHYLVDANNHTGYAQVFEELSAVGGAPSRSYVIGDDMLGQATSTTTSWLLYDGHGNTRQLVKGAADVTSQYHFDAYGGSVTTLPTTPETSLLYCGEQFDSTLQMYNLRARYYDQGTGRFNQRDPFRGNNFDPQSFHKYIYAHNEPINHIDPSGRAIGGTIIELLLVVGIALNIFSYYHHQKKAGQAFAAGQTAEGLKNQAWAMVDLAFLLVPGSGLIGPGGRLAYAGAQSAYVAAQAAANAEKLLKAGVAVSSVWGYAMAMARGATDWGDDSGDGGGSGGSNDGPGRWEPEEQTHWSPEAQVYQWQVTGRQGQAYSYNDISFDGWDAARGVLLEAKSDGAKLVLQKWWQKQHNFEALWQDWAKGRVNAAGNTPVEAHFANKELADQVRKAIGDIPLKVIHTPSTTVIP